MAGFYRKIYLSFNSPYWLALYCAKVRGEWILILAGIQTIVFGVFALMLPFTGSVAAICILNLYALLNSTFCGS